MVTDVLMCMILGTLLATFIGAGILGGLVLIKFFLKELLK